MHLHALNTGGETMGIYVDYSFYAECSEEELLRRLDTFRQRVLELPVVHVGEVKRVDPVCNDLVIHLLEANDCPIPPAVKKRLKGRRRDDETFGAGMHMSLDLFRKLPGELKERYYAPALEFIETTDLWNEDDYPEELTLPFVLTYPRKSFLFEFAAILLRYGFMMSIDPGEGSEKVRVALSTYRSPRTPLWFGGSFTKTQYATEFVRTHETVCQIMAVAPAPGLLYPGSGPWGV
jgi:hypothetical protein